MNMEDHTTSCCNPWQQGTPGDIIQQQHSEYEPLANDLNSLSVKERNQLFEEIHGVADIIEERPDMVAACIEEMKNHIRKMNKKMKKDLEKAFFFRPSLEKDVSFYLMFLRAKRFNTLKAAQCMCVYFTNKIELFGEALIVEKITLAHLSNKELGYMRSGAHQFLKGRESTGRVVATCTISLWDTRDWKSFCRYMWYMIVTLAEENEDVQKRGCVAVYSFHNPYSARDFIFFLRQTEVFHSNWPLFLNALHQCSDNPVFKTLFRASYPLVAEPFRIRQRLQFGSLLETKHALVSFGIDVHDCFEPGIGSLRPEVTQAFIEERFQIEKNHMKGNSESDVKDNILTHPKPHDVIMGSVWQRYATSWPGNSNLNEMIKAVVPIYRNLDPTDRHAKTMITTGIIRELFLKYGSRFLDRKADRSGWEEVHEDAARIKVGRAIRNVCAEMGKLQF